MKTNVENIYELPNPIEGGGEEEGERETEEYCQHGVQSI
jgi:hypothetical protein